MIEFYFPGNWVPAVCEEWIAERYGVCFPYILELYRGHNGTQFWFTYVLTI
jgi:predicted ATP-dependent Lon-type protease